MNSSQPNSGKLRQDTFPSKTWKSSPFFSNPEPIPESFWQTMENGITETVQIKGVVTLFGQRCVLYQNFPHSGGTLCTPVEIFMYLYYPADLESIEWDSPSPKENSISTTSLSRPRRWFSVLQRFWGKFLHRSKNA